MDARSNNGPLIAAGGGLLLFISLFLGWFGAEGFDETASAWEAFSVLDVILAAIGLGVAVISLLLLTGNSDSLPAAPGSVVTTASLIALSIVGANVLDTFEGIEREFGMFLGLLGTILMLVGGLQFGRGVSAQTPRTRPTTEAPPPPPPAAGV